MNQFEYAKEAYAALGCDVEKAVDALENTTISLHCWQGDDVKGFENAGSLDGGLAVTGNYPGAARTAEELRADLDVALSLLGGKKKVNIHAIYREGDSFADRDKITPDSFKNWADWACERKIGLDFNPTCFAHPKASDGLTLSHPDKAIRDFWIEHVAQSRKISEYLGKKTGVRSVNNIWVPDGYKDNTYDKYAPRERLIDSLDKACRESLDPRHTRDAVESKVFGIGSESYVVGSHEFYMLYTGRHPEIMITLDAGHFHPTEMISSKISSVLAFRDEMLLHVSRPVRWDSDHVVILDDELCAIAQEITRGGFLPRVNLALDYFDASINRICAWVLGVYATQKALLKAMLEPVDTIKKAEYAGDFTTRLVLTEHLKTMPFDAVWNYFLEKNNLPTGLEWFSRVMKYQDEVTSKR